MLAVFGLALLLTTCINPANSGDRATRTLPTVKAVSTYRGSAGGVGRTLAIALDGSLWGWGLELSGQFGDETIIRPLVPVKLGVENDWAYISVGNGHAMAIRTDGSLWGWGWKFHGAIGDGVPAPQGHRTHTPVQIGIEKSDWTHVSAGPSRTLAIREGGSLWAWGRNQWGQLGVGNGMGTDALKPVRVNTLYKDWIAVSAGGGHTVAIRGDGSLWAWGWNGRGPVGDGTTIHRHAPVRIGSYYDWAYVSTGLVHTVAIRDDGFGSRTLWAWGGNDSGQLGDGTGGNIHSYRTAPTRVDTPHDDWVSVSAGAYHTFAIREDGSLWGWGSNLNRLLGDGAGSGGWDDNRLRPVRISR